MALVVITLHDEGGEVRVGFQSEPPFTAVVGAPVSPAQQAAQFMLSALQVHLQKKAASESRIITN